MADTNRILAWRNDATDQLHLLATVTTTSVVNTTFTTSFSFDRAFLTSTDVKVMGSNVRRAGAGAANVIANTTAMSVYLRNGSPSTYTDGDVGVEVTVEGMY